METPPGSMPEDIMARYISSGAASLVAGLFPAARP